MRRAEMPQRLLDRLLPSRPPGPLDDRAADRLQRTLLRMKPDPLFRRRLRSSVVNYYVASREGHLSRRARRPRRQMGTLGRSVLYASVVLVFGVSAVGAASQQSLPGDPLYGIKLRLEEIRMEIAPASVRDSLAQIALGERTRELEQLVASGAWARVPDAAQRLAAAEVALLAIDPAAADAPATDRALSVLQTVLEDAPAAALPGLQRAIQAASHGQDAAAPPGQATGAGTAGQGTQPRPSSAAQPSPPGQDPGKQRGPH